MLILLVYWFDQIIIPTLKLESSMSFGGSASAMNQTIRANRALVRERTTYKEIHERFGNSKTTKRYRFRKATPEYLKNLREKLQKRNRRNSVLKLLVFSIFTIAISTLLYQFLTAY